jgi:hypothetical protein
LPNQAPMAFIADTVPKYIISTQTVSGTPRTTDV